MRQKNMNDDIALLRRYVEVRDESAFAELVRRHLGLVYGAALRQLGGVAHRAEEVTQSVFTDLAQKAAALTRRNDIVGWLYTSTHFAAAKLKRSEQRRQGREQEAYLMNERLSDSAQEAAWERLRPVLDEAMHELDERDREVILLRFFQGRRLAAVGERLGLSEDAARMRVDRALEKLRVLLGRRQITSTTAALGLVLASQPAVALPATLAGSITAAALASTPAGGGAVAGATFFMSTKTIVTTTVAALALGFAIYEFNVARHERDATAALVRERNGLQARLRTAQGRIAAVQQQNAALQGEVATLRSAPPPAAPANTGPKPAAGGVMFLSAGEPALGISTPGGSTLTDAINEVYAPFFRQSGMTAEQRAQFLAVMLEWKARSNALFSDAVSKGIKPDNQMAREFWATAEAEREVKMRATLGDGMLAAFQRFETQGPLRAATSQLVTSLFRSELPLSPAQADQLVTIMAGNVQITNGKVDLTTLNIDAIETQAQSVLASSQLPVWRRTLEGVRLSEQMRRQQKK